jgi:hypothetical protein
VFFTVDDSKKLGVSKVSVNLKNGCFLRGHGEGGGGWSPKSAAIAACERAGKLPGSCERARWMPETNLMAQRVHAAV